MPLSMKPARHFSRFLAAACFATVVSLFIPWDAARADELQDVSKLVANGKLDDAGKRADAFLVKNPQDAQMRFLKGVILTQRGQRDNAIKVYTGITQDYPELPEPYNNLAVIYAAQGEYDKARGALEMAIRITPNYATAYENLGDVHAALATQAYQSARRFDANNAAALRKLNAARVLLTGNSGAAPGAPSSTSASTAPSAPATASPASSAPRSQRNVGLPAPAGARAAIAGVGATAPDVVISANATSVPSGSNIVAIEKEQPADASSQTSLATAPATPAIVPSNADQAKPIADVTAVVRRWAASRSMQIDDLKVRVDGDTATAHFRETAANPRRVSNKLLNLKQTAGDWTITGERSEP
ncbi:MAG: tetratricopeptide repeat protein [Burkholderiaceae bacterium]